MTIEKHRGKPECEECGGSGEVEAYESGMVYDCGGCDRTGETEWSPFEPDNEPGTCDRCADTRNDETEKPVSENTGLGDCGTLLCAACYQAQHDKLCGCGEAVVTPEQIAQAKAGAP